MQVLNTVKGRITIAAIIAILVCLIMSSYFTIKSQQDYIEGNIHSGQMRQLKTLDILINIKLDSIRNTADRLRVSMLKDSRDISDFETYKDLLDGFREGGGVHRCVYN